MEWISVDQRFVLATILSLWLHRLSTDRVGGSRVRLVTGLVGAAALGVTKPG